MKTVHEDLWKLCQGCSPHALAILFFQSYRNGSIKYMCHPQTVCSWEDIFLSVQTGLVEKKLNRPELALDCFFKLQAILKNHPQVLYQIASMYPFPLTSKSDCNTLKDQTDAKRLSLLLFLLYLVRLRCLIPTWCQIQIISCSGHVSLFL